MLLFFKISWFLSLRCFISLCLVVVHRFRTLVQQIKTSTVAFFSLALSKVAGGFIVAIKYGVVLCIPFKTGLGILCVLPFHTTLNVWVTTIDQFSPLLITSFELCLIFALYVVLDSH